ncbi:MAG: lipid kinase [Candidatus Eremiobacteraeota bacterium]|nr:lipid kinase [Candidatus Eremiobacteraeota bacterium]
MATLSGRRALFCVNRKSRRGGQQIDEAEKILRDYDFSLIERPTQSADEVLALIRRYRKDADLVIMGGGDGTLNSGVDGLVETKLPLGILPLGTANDLAKTLNIPATLPEACAVIAAGHYRPVDVGTVNGKYFFNEAGCGLSKRMARHLSKGDKSIFGVLAVAASGLRVLQSARPFEAEIRCDDKVTQIRTMHLMVGNGQNFGGVISSSDAQIDDSKLDLYSLEIEEPWEVIKALPDIVRGSYVDSAVVRVLQGREFEIRTKRPLAVDTDGEITTRTPAIFRIVPRAINIFVPAPS